jgi:acyl-CoA synthetase (AMP-forming)/AMP-acid ligase II
MMGLTEPLHRAAHSTPHKPATIFGERTRSWAEFKDRAARLAAGLKSHGVNAGDPIAILALNSDRYLEYYYAVWWLGAVVVPMNIRWSVAENAYSLNDSDAKVMFIDAQFSPLIPQIKAEAKGLTTLIYLDDENCPEGLLDFEALIANNAPMEDARKNGEDLAGIFYTGGTTGFPKGVLIPHRALWFNGLSLAKLIETSEETKYLHAAPMFHLADGAASLATTAVGGTHVIIPMFTPDGVLTAIGANKITHSLLVPTMIGMLVQSQSYTPDHLSTLTHLIYGGSPIPEGILRQLIGELPWVGLINAYGQTEMAPVISALAPKHHVLDGPHADRFKSVGQVAPGVEIRIVNEDGKDVARGDVGEIIARSPGSMQGYHNKPEQTAATLNNGWVKTGDGARMDKDGFLFIVDRVKDMVITGGENVFSAEVENAVSTFAGVLQVAVIGIPDERWGEAVHAIIVTENGAPIDREAITQHCRNQLANYKLPRSFEFRAEPLPLSGAGKVLKRELRKPYWDGLDKGVS